MSRLSQNSLAMANLQLQGWEGVNLQLRQQGLCQQGPLHATQAAAFKRRQTPLLQVPLFPPDTHRSMLLNVWHSSPVPGLPSLCNATPVQHCPGFLQSHQTCWAAELNPKLPAGSLTQAVTIVPDPSSTSAWGKRRQGAPMPGR